MSYSVTVKYYSDDFSPTLMQNATGKAELENSQHNSQGGISPTALRWRGQYGAGGTKQHVKEPLCRSACTVLAIGTHIVSTPGSARSAACVALAFPQGIFQLHILLKKAKSLLFVSQNMGFSLML